MILKVISLLICFGLNFTNANYDETSAEREYNLHVYKRYIHLDDQLKDIARKGVKMFLPYLMEARESLNISKTCTTNAFQLLLGIRDLKEWAISFLDAVGKPQTGLISGNIFMVGEYNECLDITIKKKDGTADFQGQYCTIYFKPALPIVKKKPSMYERLEGLSHATRNTSEIMRYIVSKLHFGYYIKGIRFGLCVPSGCNTGDVTEIINFVSQMIEFNATTDYCVKKSDIIFWTTPTILSIGIFALLVALTLIATLLEMILKTWKIEKSSASVKILQCFSLPSNFSKLYNRKSQEKSLQCLHGIRAISMFWIILGNEIFVIAESELVNHVFGALQKVTLFLAQILWNAVFAFDAFFFLSGFLNSYTRTKIMMDGKKEPGIVKIFIHRLWRIYPALTVGHLLFFLLNKPMPSDYAVLQEKNENCERNWWMNFLFVNNLIKYEHMCLGPTWFLTVDMQLFLLSLFTVPLLLRSPKKGIAVNICLIFLGNLWFFIWSWMKQLPPATIDISRNRFSDIYKLDAAYFYPIPHFGPYSIGLLLGYFSATKKDIKISKLKQAVGWLLAAFFFLSTIFIIKIWNSGQPYSRLESSLYGAFSRTLYTLPIAWMVLCCTNGYGGYINSILSLKVWFPISKLAYMMYLTSHILQIFFQSNSSFPFDFSIMSFIWSFFGNLSITLLVSLTLVIFAESPFIALEKLLFCEKEEEDETSSGAPNGMTWNNMNGQCFKDYEKVLITHL